MSKSDQSESDPIAVGIEVLTTYLPNHSSPEESYYTFAYTITISNNGDVPVQLLSRHWIITDADNQVQEVRGEGVIGEQPVIAPGEYFRYTSGTSMETTVGFMEGSYTMVVIHENQPAETFEVPIPTFSLHTPNALH
jgi:ApaG protein